MDICDITFDDIISESIINFYNSYSNKNEIDMFLNLYKSDKKFYDYIQKNLLINKINSAYLLRLLNDYDNADVIDEYDVITVTTTRWI